MREHTNQVIHIAISHHIHPSRDCKLQAAAWAETPPHPIIESSSHLKLHSPGEQRAPQITTTPTVARERTSPVLVSPQFLSMMLYGIENPLASFGSAVLAASSPHIPAEINRISADKAQV